MTDLLLRDAVEQMRAHLRAAHFSEAFALGQHILHSFPKHVETYTILAQASLETNDISSATDLFRRVLSADPENVLALAGMALISEAQDKYDEALWFLERAFEIQPTNDELRGELLRVREMYYGTAPARLELTSGALARVYARQGQYAQAVNEFRRLLRNDSKRYDARVALAETLYRAGRTDEAAQVAQQVMADAPYSLKPNLILGALWTENAVPEGQQFLQRAHQLDPEHRVARDLLGERFDGAQQPRLPAFGERGMPTAAPALGEGAEAHFVLDTEALRAADMLREIERAQESTSAFEEPLFADFGGDDSVQAGMAKDTAERIVDAEQATGLPLTVNATAESAGQVGKGKKEPISPTASAAAAAALATSIALDKTNQPSPTLRAHPAIPKVRPVVRGAADKLPAWLRLAAPPANAPASFDAASDTDRAAPEADADAERPDWLVQAQAASAQETITPQMEIDLPDWLKPAAAAVVAKEVIESASSSQPAPSGTMPQASAVEPPGGFEGAPVATTAAAASVIALPEWLTGKSESPQADPQPVKESAVATEGWTNVPEDKTGERPALHEMIEQEPLPVRAEAETNSFDAMASDAMQPTTQPIVESAHVSETFAAAESVNPIEEPTPTQAQPDSATMLQMARDKRDSGDMKGALELYERVMHRRPNHLDQVTGDLEEIVNGGSAPTTANRLLGEAYAMVGRFKESLEQYRIAMGK